jgi:16S rRNA (cytosine1407-C5)-methyltransferase
MDDRAIPPVFDAYYQALYGPRWEGLKKSILRPSIPISYGEGLVCPYNLDYASVLTARSLRLPGEGLVLDACAAPGGKSLVIASRMGAGTRLLANELSSDRRRRLLAALDAHLGRETRGRVAVSGFDAAREAGRASERGRFAAILLDAPCSSERHLLGDPRALSRWTPARPRFLARRQWALLSAAFLLLKPGGSLVYATCALSPEENDGVAARLLAKYGGAVEEDPLDFDEGKKTRHGRLILPDSSGGMGPIYAARFRKRPESGTTAL